MRINSAIVLAAVSVGSADALFGFLRRFRKTKKNSSNCNSCCAQNNCQATTVCHSSVTVECSTVVQQNAIVTALHDPCFNASCSQPAVTMMANPCNTPSCSPMVTPCSAPTCPPTEIIVQEVKTRPVKIKTVEYKPVIKKRTIQETYIVNKRVKINQAPVCQPVCPPSLVTCILCPAV